MKRMMFSALILLAMTALAVTTSAQPGPGGCSGQCTGPHHGMRFDGHPGFGGGPGGQFGQPGMMGILRHADDLGLTDDQKSKLEDMQTQFAKERIDLKAEMEKAQIDLRQLMKADNPNEMAVSSAIDRTTKLRGDMAKMRFRHKMAVQKVLTADQIKKLKEMPKKMMSQRHGRCDGMGMGMGMGKGMGKGQGQNSDQNLPRPRRDRSSW